LQYALTINVT